MIDRSNYQLAQGFLGYLRDVTQIDAVSVERYWVHLKQLVLWADDTAFRCCVEKRPTFAAYLTAKQETKTKPMSSVTLKKIFQTAKRFFTWAKATHPRDFRAIPLAWIEALRLPRTTECHKDHEFVTVEEVRQLAALKVDPPDLALMRDQAAAVMLFLSGMRAGAFASLTMDCVDLPNRTIKQWPSLGVKTKNSKSATTFLLDIPDLLAVVSEWDRIVRAQLPGSGFWYAPIAHEWGKQTISKDTPGANRGIALGKRLRKLLVLAGLPLHSPHKFRHGHAVFALQHANTMADYKAVSMNLMHSDIRVTDGIYAPLARDEVKQRIAGLTATGRTSLADDRTTSNVVGLTDDELINALATRLKGEAR